MKKKFTILSVTLILCLGLFACCANTGKVISEEPFYSLQAAYNQDLLSRSNLRSAAKLHRNGNNESLDAQVAERIKQAYSALYSEEELGDVVINEYLGTYNGCVVLMIRGEKTNFTDALWDETVAGVKFEYHNGQRIVVWKE